ncbi:MAG TPA: nucleotidyl transferase AbiEii/AbiGii toxin family protein [Planctomycetota bacterium]
MLGEGVVALGKLTALQARVLGLLSPLSSAWTLTGGGALCGFHLQHRVTRDLDLFWHGLRAFAREPDACEHLLRQAGLRVDVLQRSPAFVRFRCADSQDAVLVDLVAEPVPSIEPPTLVAANDATIRIDTEYEIFVNKLGTLLHRTEMRDLVDLRALLARGADLTRGLRDAATKDRGFSPLMVGHLLAAFPVRKLAEAAGMPATEAADLDRFRADLAVRVAQVAHP